MENKKSEALYKQAGDLPHEDVPPVVRSPNSCLYRTTSQSPSNRHRTSSTKTTQVCNCFNSHFPSELASSGRSRIC